MKIAFVSQPPNVLQPSAQFGSMTSWTVNVAQGLARRGHDVVVYARRNEGQASREVHEGVEYRRVSMLPDRVLHRLVRGRLGGRRDRPFFASALHHPGYALAVAADLRRRGADVAHVFNYTQFAPTIRKLNPRTRIVLNMGCEWLDWLDRRMVARRLRAVDWVTSNSDYLSDLARRAHPQIAARCVTVPRGVDVDRFSPPPEGRRPHLAGAALVLFVGRVSPEKGVHVLLDAFARVLAVHPGARLRVIGAHSAAPRDFLVRLSDDPHVQALERFYRDGAGDYVETLRSSMAPAVADAVELVGPVPNAELVAHYRAADLLVLPSVCPEPFGIPLVEAMATGLPVLASRAGGMGEIVDEGVTGLLVSRDDAAGLADAVLRLLDDDALRQRMGAAARRRAVERYSFDRVIDQMLPYYSG